MRLLALLLLLSIPAYADPITLNGEAHTCPTCYYTGAPPAAYPTVDLLVTLTVQAYTGRFFFPRYSDYLTGTVWEVLSMEGTYNGLPVTLRQSSVEGPLWLSTAQVSPWTQYGAGLITFTAGGLNYNLWADNTSAMVSGVYNPRVSWRATEAQPQILTAQAVPVPESSTFWLLIVGAALAKIAWRKYAA